ncbi:MAG: isochorismate synthase [Candidatus Marinimicrobia bacterium]|nr:isochorismate synthase [Candidatus Neomarinimicrobiota bacterium]
MSASSKALHNQIKNGVTTAIKLAKTSNEDTFISCSVDFESTDLLPILTHPADRSVMRVYWEHPTAGFSMAGLGCVFSVDITEKRDLDSAGNTMMNILNRFISCNEDQDDEPCMVGGHSFNLAKPSDPTWKNFPRGRFILPECLAIRKDGHTKLIISRRIKQSDSIDRISEEFSRTAIHYSNRLPVTLPPIRYFPVDKFRDIPDKEEYHEIILSILQQLKPGVVDKVVISRSHHVKVSKAFRAVSALQVLRNAYHDCTSFMFNFPGEGTFFGSTPERLIQKSGNLINTEALAGTIGRGKNMEEDRLLMESLLDSHKEQEEHRFVVDQIIRKLKPLTRNLDIQDFPGIFKLKNVQHLRTAISGELNNGKNILDLIKRLHPTPAVAGTPTDRAMELITKFESHDRGWYSGPIGWIDKQGDGDFWVALRSALVNDDEAHVFAGGGIMAESVPENEWKETELKLMPVISALSGGQI